MQFYPSKQVDTSKQRCLTHVPEALHTSDTQALLSSSAPTRSGCGAAPGFPSPPWPSPAEHTNAARQGMAHVIWPFGGGPIFDHHKPLSDKQKQELTLASLSLTSRSVHISSLQELNQLNLMISHFPRLKYHQHHFRLSSWDFNHINTPRCLALHAMDTCSGLLSLSRPNSQF